MQISELAMHAGEFAMRHCGECGRTFVVEVESQQSFCPSCAQKYAPKDKPTRVTFYYSRKYRCTLRVEWRGHCPIASHHVPFDFWHPIVEVC